MRLDMIFGSMKIKNWKTSKVIGTTKHNGVQILGKLNNKFSSRIEATKYDTKIQALSAISNYCHSRKFREMIVERWGLVLDIVHSTMDDKYFYISVSEKKT